MTNPFKDWTDADVDSFNARTHSRPHPNYHGKHPLITQDDHPVPADAVEVESDLHDAIIKFCKHKGWVYLHGSMAYLTRRTLGCTGGRGLGTLSWRALRA